MTTLHLHLLQLSLGRVNHCSIHCRLAKFSWFDIPG